MSKFLFLTLAAFLTPALAPDPGEKALASLQSELREARRDYDDGALESLQTKLLGMLEKAPDSFSLRTLIAETYLRRANLLRTDRSIRSLERATVKQYRARQAEWGALGLTHARRALELARFATQKALAERLCGELYVHQISGPIAGLINGPKALDHISSALSLAPSDAECLRAQGLMFLYNPPINGGDLDRAVQTFRRCIELNPDSDEYHVYLSMAFRKKGNLIRAEVAAKKALRLNPHNVDAKHLVEEVSKARSADHD